MENQGYFSPDDVVGTCVIRCGPFGKYLLVSIHCGFDDRRARCEAIEADAIEFDDSWCDDMPGDVMDYLHNDDYFDPKLWIFRYI